MLVVFLAIAKSDTHAVKTVMELLGNHCYNAVSLKGTCIVNAYCQFSQQASTNFMQIYLYSLISTHFFILTTNLHCFMNSPNCTNNDIDALEIQIIEIVLYLNTNLHSILFFSCSDS